MNHNRSRLHKYSLTKQCIPRLKEGRLLQSM